MTTDLDLTKEHDAMWLVIHGEPYEGQRRRWNPLTDDGDALRLAQRLAIPIQPSNRTDYGCGVATVDQTPTTFNGVNVEDFDK